MSVDRSHTDRMWFLSRGSAHPTHSLEAGTLPPHHTSTAQPCPAPALAHPARLCPSQRSAVYPFSISIPSDTNPTPFPSHPRSSSGHLRPT